MCAPSAFAQGSGAVTGHVSDPSGASVAGATISLTNLATSASRNTVSTDTGDYTFDAVPPGAYAVRAERPGFKRTESKRFDVQIEQTVRLDFALQLGSVSESIEVSASAEMLQSENASLGTVVNNEAVTQLPLNGREYLGLVALSSNVDTLAPSSGQAGSREGGDRAIQSISAAGQRIMFDYFTLDGTDNTDPDFNTYVAMPSIDAIQEFKVQTGVYPAEFGHEATQINVITKSGGNTYHGALFEFLRNDVFDAMPYSFTSIHPSKSPFKWNDFGFELDGPIYLPKIYNGKNRFFFMVNDEWLLLRQNNQSLYTLPTAAEEAGDFSALPTTIYNPATKQPFPNNIIPKSMLDPISLKLLTYYPAAILPTSQNNYPLMTSAPSNRDSFTLRSDFIESSKSQWAFRYSWGNEDSSSTGLAGAGSKLLTNYDQYMASNTRSITPNLLNEARFGYSSFFNSIGTLSAFTNNVVGKLAIPGLNAGDPSTWGIPDISFNGLGLSIIGDIQDGPYVLTDTTGQAVDNLSWIKGKHSLRFGFEYDRENFNQLGNQFSRGNFIFQASATQSASHTGGNAFADFLLGDLYQSTVAVAIANAKYQRNVEAAYVDDTYKVTSKLTLSLGLRYELTPPWVDTLGNEFTVAIPQLYFAPHAPQSAWPYFVRQGNCSNAYQGLSISWTDPTGKAGTQASPAPVCSNGKFPDALMKTAYNNWAPRISIAYSPQTKTVIRTGFGIFYNQDIGNATFDLARNIAGRVTQTSSLATPTLFYSNAVPGGNGAIAQIPPPYAYSYAYDHKTSYTMEYLLNIQQQVGTNWLFEAGYLGNVSRHLYGFQNANQVIPYGYLGSSTFTPISSRIPFPNYGVIQLVQDGGIGNYNSLSIKATRRFNNGFNVISSYTFAKSMDDTSGIRNQGFDTLFPQNSDCIRCDYALSAFDVRHRIVGSLLYELPVGSGRKWSAGNSVVNAVVGGWEAGAIITWQTGVPGTLGLGGADNASTGASYDRPNATGISPYESTPTPSRWLNPAAYTEAAPGFFGNVGRNTVEGPHIFNMDAEVHKQFKMPYNEHHLLQFRIEAFNSLNHPNWGMPNLNILAGPAFPGQAATSAHQNFGTISSTQTAMRQVQLGLKYVF